MINSNSITNIYSLLRRTGIYSIVEGSPVYAELAAYDTAFSILEEAITSLASSRFVSDADTDSIAKYEELVGVPSRQGAGLSQRRDLILNRLAISPVNSTTATFSSSFPSAGMDGIFIENSNDTEKYLEIFLNNILDSSLSISQVEYFLSKLMPAHVSWYLQYGKLTFNLYDSYDKTFNQYEVLNYSWNDFDGSDSLA